MIPNKTGCFDGSIYAEDVLVKKSTLTDWKDRGMIA